MVTNIYCDESCHLINDHIPTMVLGAIWCPTESVRELVDSMRGIRIRHGIPARRETKWTKVSDAKIGYYLDLISWFFSDDRLRFRGVVIPDKAILDHLKFNQTHDIWYYKMYFIMLKHILSPHDEYNIYIDIKDTRGGDKVAKLRDVLRNNMYDFNGTSVKRIQIIRSHEVELMQLADLIIGALGYFHRGLTTSDAKSAIVKRIIQLSQSDLLRSTMPRIEKFNVLVWRPNGADL